MTGPWCPACLKDHAVGRHDGAPAAQTRDRIIRPACDWHPDGCPTADPGRSFFVSVVKPGTRDWRALAGPYDTHLEALAKVKAADWLAQKRDPRAAFYAFGTVQAPSHIRTIFGRI